MSVPLWNRCLDCEYHQDKCQCARCPGCNEKLVDVYGCDVCEPPKEKR